MSTNAVSSSNSAQAVYDSLNTRQDTTTAVSKTQSNFLALLTAQLKNQDPLNPLDNAQMTSQMAQISTVDGIERLNATLQSMLSGSSDSQTMQAAALVGRNVLVPGSTLTLAGGKAVAGFELAGPADNATATIKDANGLVIRTVNLGSFEAGVRGFAWDGKTDSGAQAADGVYTVSFAAKQGKNDVSVTALSVGTVSGVSRNGQTFNLDVAGLGRYGLDEVKEIL
jgi:flagellar basal-body rod modification protein FlgD